MVGKTKNGSKVWFICLASLLFLALIASQGFSASVVIDHPNPQAGANFGSAMAAVGDVDGDGVPDLLVGAPLQNVGGNPDQGQAYVISGAGGALLLTLDDPTPQAGAKFGGAVAGVGDVNNDGKFDFLVGAPAQNVGPCQIGDTSGCSVGQAFVFSGADGGLLLTLNHPNPKPSLFGTSVASPGDLDGDLIPDIVVGTPGEAVGVFTPGQVFVFSGATGSLLFSMSDPNPQEVESGVGLTFGSVVASLGDLNNDGVSEILVGDARQDAGGNVDQGQVHLFNGLDGSLIRTIDHPAAQAGSRFGVSAVSAGDINGDGKPDVLVGASRQDVAGYFDQGQAYVFSGSDGSLLLTLDNPNPMHNGEFAAAVAALGDISGDGFPDLLIGAPGQTVNGIKQGQAFIFSGADGSLLQTLDNTLAQPDSAFGAVVAAAGDNNKDGKPDALVAAPFLTVNGNPLQGRVGVFDANPGGGAGGNQAPVANAGPDQTVNEGALVNLNGNGSSDPDGSPLTFLWTQTGGPAVALSSSTSPTPTFTAPQVAANTILTFQLVVNDGTVNSLPDTVNITVLNVSVNQPPIANAGLDQNVNEGSLVTLNGSGSSDPDGNPLTFFWTQTAGPAATLSNSTSATPTFTAPQVSATTVLTFQLVVSDGFLSSSDTVNITVLDTTCGVDFTGTISKLTRKTSKGKDTLSFTLAIFNGGTVQSKGSFKVKFYLSADTILGSGDTLVYTKSMKDTDSEGRIKPGNTVNISGSVTITGPTQGKYLIAHIDSENAICESNESNNLATRQIP